MFLSLLPVHGILLHVFGDLCVFIPDHMLEEQHVLDFSFYYGFKLFQFWASL